MANYVLLDRIELNDTAASVTFDNIPQSGYTDLKIVASYRGSGSLPYEISNVRFNGLTTNLSSRTIEGSGSAASSFTNPTIYFGSGNGNTSTANTFSNMEMYVPNYRLSNFKSVSIDAVGETNATAIAMQLTAGLWSSTAAITSIQIVPTNSFLAGSTFSLYGIAQVGTTPAIAPKADGGNVIGTDGTYWYHAFLSNGTFTPAVGLSCDYLVVAGGGSGGSAQSGYSGGGGGAGGLLSGSTLIAASTATTITIGAGAPGQGGQTAGSNGVNSTLQNSGLTVTATGGGGGGWYGYNQGSAVGKTGGSGGGSGGGNTSPGSGTSGQGNSGGTNSNTNPSTTGGAGGGGASAAGSTPPNFYTGGAGGAGTASSISGTSVTYAGGGGGSGDAGYGGAGGAGGGGSSSGNSGNAGTANSGGGGGGAKLSPSGSGGSGIIIIRYPVA